MQTNDKLLEEIKNKISIVDIISRKVKLSKKGNEHIGLCPFHNEKTPSFSVSESKGVYHCFGCQAGGDIFKFITETENMNFLETIKYLADIAGIELTHKNINNQKKLQPLYDLMSISKEWFKEQLYKSEHHLVRKYLKNRNLSQKSIDKFEIGFAPDNKDSLFKYLLSKNFTKENIHKVGLIINKNMEIFDKFRNRIIFPIYDIKGNVVAFGGRAFNNAIPKYLNSPETEIFHKSSILYGENFVKNASRKRTEILVVEGYMDLISLNQFGIEYVVATMGTALTDQQILQLWKHSNEPLICLDGDAAGKNAMKRAAYKAIKLLPEAKSLNFIILPHDMDPDDILRNYGINYFQDLINNNQQNLSDVIWQDLSSKLDKKTPEKISNLEKKIEEIINSIINQRIRKNYQRFFTNKIWQLNKHSFKKKELEHLPTQINDEYNKITKIEYHIIAEILITPQILKDTDIYDKFLEIDFSQEILNILRTMIIDFYDESSNKIDYNQSNLRSYIIECGYEKIYNKLCGPNSYFSDKISKSNNNFICNKWHLLYKQFYLSKIEKEYHEYLQTNNYNEEKIQLINLEIQRIQSEIHEATINIDNQDV